MEESLTFLIPPVHRLGLWCVHLRLDRGVIKTPGEWGSLERGENRLLSRCCLGGSGIPPGGPAPLLGLTSFSMYPDDPDIIGWRPLLRLQATQTGFLALDWDENYWEYVLQQNPDLNPLHWVTVENQPELYGALLRVTLAPPRGRMFYRLIK